MLLPRYARGRGVMRQNTIEREKGGCRRRRNSWAPPFIPVISRARRRCIFKERVSLEELPSAISSLTHLTDIANLCRLQGRMLKGKTPGGIYKLSREALLASELPSRFTTRANWRGSFPRDILCNFCRQHRLSEPLFSIISHASKEPTESCGSNLKVADLGRDVIGCVNGAPTTSRPMQSDTEMFQCEVKLLSRCENLIIKCFPKDCFKKQNDAIQNASLKLLVWLNNNFNNTVVPFEPLYEAADIFGIQIFSENFF